MNSALGGVVAGIYKQEFIDSEFEANQGSMIIVIRTILAGNSCCAFRRSQQAIVCGQVIDVERLLPLAELQGQMDKFVASAEAAQPFPGEPAAYLPGRFATTLSDAVSRCPRPFTRLFRARCWPIPSHDWCLDY